MEKGGMTGARHLISDFGIRIAEHSLDFLAQDIIRSWIFIHSSQPFTHPIIGPRLEVP
jgi:hypothetical protein